MHIGESGQVVAFLQASGHPDRVFLLLVVASDSLYFGIALCCVEFARAAIGFSQLQLAALKAGCDCTLLQPSEQTMTDAQRPPRGIHTEQVQMGFCATVKHDPEPNEITIVFGCYHINVRRQNTTTDAFWCPAPLQAMLDDFSRHSCDAVGITGMCESELSFSCIHFCYSRLVTQRVPVFYCPTSALEICR